MTIPIVPGPFSFLGSVGQALGEFGKVKEDRERENRDEANKDLDTLMRQVELGILPRAILGTPEARRLFDNAGIGLPSGVQPVPSITAMTANRVRDLVPGAQRDRALGIPTEGEVAATEGTAAVITGIAGAQRAAIAAGGAAGRAVTGVPAEGLAAGAEAVQQAQIDAAKAEAEQAKAIDDLVVKNLNEPDFARWAAIADAGFLPLYLQRISISTVFAAGQRQQMGDRFRLLFQPLEDSPAVFRAFQERWTISRNTFIQFEDPDPKELLEWEEQNPQPTFETVRNDLVTRQAMSLFPEASSPQDAVTRYFAELNTLTGKVSNAIIAPNRRVQLEKAADMIVSGQGTLEDALAQITDTLEQAELQAMVQAKLQGKNE